MPRVGRHPLKTNEVLPEYQPRRLTVATVVHIPVLEGYWTHSLEVLKLFFASLYAHTSEPFDLMVLDNGSCQEVKNYLLAEQAVGHIQYLIFSQNNLRKTGALKFLLEQAPGEYITFADSDVYFLPGWLDDSLKIFEKFPEVGMVTASPLATNQAAAYRPILEVLRSQPDTQIEQGVDLIPDSWIAAHAASLGQSFQAYVSARLSAREDVRVTRDDVSMFLVSVDFQYTTTRRVVDAVMPLRLRTGEQLRGDQIYIPVWETRLDEQGFWRVSTSNYGVHHMGNRPPDLVSELPWLSPGALKAGTIAQLSGASGRLEKRGLLGNRILRRWLRALNLFIYRLLYE